MAGADQFERSGVSRWIAGDRVVFAIELAGPLVVGGLAGAVHAVHHAFVAVADGGIHDGQVLGRARSDLRFRLIQFPRADIGVRAKVTATALAGQNAVAHTNLFMFMLLSPVQKHPGGKDGRKRDWNERSYSGAVRAARARWVCASISASRSDSTDGASDGNRRRRGTLTYISPDAHRTLKTRASRRPMLQTWQQPTMELPILDLSNTCPDSVQALKPTPLTIPAGTYGHSFNDIARLCARACCNRTTCGRGLKASPGRSTAK